MPSYRPRITIYTDSIMNKKLAYIAKAENRSSSNYTEYLIIAYEAEHGEIEIKEQEKKKIKINPLNPLGTGYAVGDALGEMVAEKIKQTRD